MKIKTSELEGAALNYCTALACGIGINLNGKEIRVDDWNRKDDRMIWSPSTDWSQGGPLIQSSAIEISPGDGWQQDGGGCWGALIGTDRADADYSFVTMDADTPLIAACRAIVAAKLGDTVDVPEGLV